MQEIIPDKEIQIKERSLKYQTKTLLYDEELEINKLKKVFLETL